ncbi:Glutathione S-transferase GstB [Hyphomicrobiales bacterium]|nr:Glutathione S-transferase GstB [Hyphomicrobiales bacterium]CAH1671684.1 Glutathione S-transferase GstB [Hyphomicrobiales bacterium]
MLTIWGRANSTNVKKALWCARELDLPFERIDAGGAFGIVDDPDYRAMNPNGLVPTVRDGELVLWESHTIVRYLAARYGDGTLYPTDPVARASMEKWMDWVLGGLTEPFRCVIWNIVRRTPAERDNAELERGLAGCAKLFAIADAALARQPYLSGAAFGVADIALGPHAYAWLGMPIERPELPHLAAWFARLNERPAFREIVAIPLT